MKILSFNLVYKIFLSSAILLLFIQTSFCQQALIDIPFSVNDGVSGSLQLNAGLDPTATDGLDTHLGEAELPPLPPSGIFDARFILPSSTIASLSDYRHGDTTAAYIDEKQHEIKYQLGSGSGGFTINWKLPTGIRMRIRDNVGGVVYDMDNLSGQGSYTVTNTGLTGMLLTLKYVDPPFPVELVSFSGYYSANKVILQWRTATELNNFGFEIEKSMDKINFNKVGFVMGNGTSFSEKSYEFTDNIDAFAGTLYYRLKQFDFNGTFDYSNLVEVNALPVYRHTLLQNYPNPFNPGTNISFMLERSTVPEFILYSASGDEVLKLSSGLLQAGYHSFEINLKGYTSGVYFLRMRADEYMNTIKLLLVK